MFREPATLTRGKNAYLCIAVALLGVFLCLGAVNELLAAFAPQLLPDVVARGLRSSRYDLLHSEPVVHWWTRGHNVFNLFVGAALAVSVGGLARRRRWGARLAFVGLVYVVVAGAIGVVVLAVWLFPSIDSIARTLPVAADTMKAAMVAGPAALIAVGAIKARMIYRYRSGYGAA